MDGNQNGKLTQQAYIDQILEPGVSKWCSDRSEWVLEEDNDSGYGNKDSNNLVQKWKRDYGITQSDQSAHRCYFNCPRSPDLAIIEDGWSYPKNYVKKRSHWDDQIVDELAREAWRQMPQPWINQLVDSMPQRLQDVIASGGQMVEMR